MRVAVGGGGGFIGRAVVGALAAAGHEAIAFGREGLGEAVDALVWAGGQRGGDAAALAIAHVDAAIAAVRAGRPARVVYLSSAEVYGRGAVPFREDAAPAPPSAYARAKLEGEARLGGEVASLVVLRPGVVYGPGQGPGMLLPSALAELAAGRPFSVTGDGAQTRDFLYVDDLAALIARALAPDAPAGLYNAGTGREVAVRDALAMLCARLGVDARLVRVGERPEREGDIRRYALDASRAAARLGWRAKVTLEDGLTALAASARRA
jgi:UDP-glucose 4-epimerase